MDTPAAGGSASEAKLTRFLMFEPTDESGLNWRIVGVLDAGDRDGAETRYYKDTDEPVRCCPVSENAWKPRTTKPRVVQPRTRVPLEIDLSALPAAASPATDGASAAVEDGPGADDPGAVDIPRLNVDGPELVDADAELAGDAAA